MISFEEARLQNEEKLKILMEEIKEVQVAYEEAKSQARHFSREETILINRLNGIKKEAKEISEKLFS